METEAIFVIYLALVVTPMAFGTIYAIYLFCSSQLKLFNLQRRIKQSKLNILLKIDFHLSKNQRNDEDFKTISEIKRRIEDI